MDLFDTLLKGLKGEAIKRMDGGITYRVPHGAGFVQLDIPESTLKFQPYEDTVMQILEWEKMATKGTIVEEEEAISLDDLIEPVEVEKKVDYGKWAVK